MDESLVAPYAVVVDDNPVILLHAVDILETAGFCVFAAGGSAEALDLLLKHAGKIVLLFTNVEIPGPLNGFDLAHYASERWTSTAILVSSGRFTPEQDDLPPGAVFLPKPFTAEQVTTEVGRLLASKDAAVADGAGDGMASVRRGTATLAGA